MKGLARYIVRDIFIEHLFRFRNWARRTLTDLLFNKSRITTGNQTKTGKILFVRLDGKYGDSIISQYLYNIIKLSIGTEIYMLSKNRESIEFFNHDIDHYILCNKPRRALHLYRAYKQIHNIHFDHVIYLGKEAKDRELILLRYIKTSNLISGDRRIRFASHFLIPEKKIIHYKQRCDNVLAYLGIPSDESNTSTLSIPKEEVDKITSKIDLPSKFIYFNPYGAGSQRKFTAEHIHKIESIVKIELPEHCIVTQSYEHLPLSADKTDSNTYLFTTKSFNEILTLISLSEFVITVDTATSHAATALGKSSIVFYNPDPDNYAEWNANSIHSKPIFSKKPRKQLLPNINNIDFSDLITALKPYNKALD